MRFPRHAKIFRGQLDAAPLAGVFFLLVIFLLLTSLTYTTGVPIQLSSTFAPPTKNISITKANEIVFENKTYKTNSLEQLRDVLKNLPRQTTLLAKVDPAARRDLVNQLRDMSDLLNLRMENPGAGIQLPLAQNTTGVEGPTAVVTVNIAGQFFFENQLIAERPLERRLAALAKQSRTPLTLIVRADDGVRYGVIHKLTQLAEEAGITNGLLQSRPAAKKARE